MLLKFVQHQFLPSISGAKVRLSCATRIDLRAATMPRKNHRYLFHPLRKWHPVFLYVIAGVSFLWARYDSGSKSIILKNVACNIWLCATRYSTRDTKREQWTFRSFLLINVTRSTFEKLHSFATRNCIVMPYNMLQIGLIRAVCRSTDKELILVW